MTREETFPMNVSRPKPRNIPSSLASIGKVFEASLTLFCCSGFVAPLLAHWCEQCLTTCLISALLAWASQLVAAAEQPSHPSVTQLQRASLEGRITSRSGQSIAGATVSLRNLKTHRDTQTRSTADGVFRLPEMPAGEYLLRVAATGYKTLVVAQLPLIAGDLAHANTVLDPGDPAEVVNGDSASVTSRLGTALAGKSVSDLPENQRNFVNLVQVSAGANEGSTNASASGSRPGAQHESSAVSIGGEPETNNFSQIDGMDNNERINSKIAVHPSVEGVENVQIFANAYPAAMGVATGGFINVVTKSGADAYHGSVYEYFRNDLLDVSPYQFGARNPKPELRQNQFGGSLGGPLFRRSTRFFADYEGFRLIQGRSPVELTVPTAYEHEHPGDFSDVGGPVLHQFDPAGLAYFRLYPLPNVSGSSNQFVSAPRGSNFSETGDGRLDQTLSANDHLFGRFSANVSDVYIPGQFPAVEEAGMRIEPGGSLTSFAGAMHDTAVNTMADWAHEFRPGIALDLRAGYVYWHESDTSLNPHVAVNRGFGQPGVNLASTGNGLAPVDVLAASPLGGDGYWRPLNQGDHVLQVGGAMRWDRRNHSMAVGSALVHRQWFDIGSADGLGMWKVADLPALLEGSFVGLDREVDLVEPRLRTWDASAYVQDSWKLTPSLTLDLGMRYDLLTPPTEAKNHLANFDFATGRVVVAGRDGVSASAGVQTDYTNVGPRFGFTWELGHAILLRGGYGLTFGRPLDGFVYKTQPFAATFGVCTSNTCPEGYTTLAAGLPEPATPDLQHLSGDLWGTRSFHERMVQAHQFNVGLEKSFAGNMARLFYVASLARHRARFFPDFNAPPPNTSSDPDSLRPYHSIDPALTAIDYVDAEGSSSYHAMQATLAHERRHGVTAHVNYTWAHGLDDASGQGFGTVPAISSKIDYGNSALDVRQRAVATLFYDVPLGRNATGRRRLALGGWQTNVAAVWSTGLPYTVLNAADVSNTNPGASAADRPNQLGAARTRHPDVDRYFNVEAFAAQVPGTLGNERSNQLYGPPTRHIDASLFKNFEVAKERTLQFRAEVFNVTNTASFASPDAVLGTANFGHLTQLTAGYSPREVQFAMRLQF
ncbi:TonB-dependent receptor [Acidobacteria bacterium AB60]|nr:TonB-dependent receptor [Acidobacteria bacterium AB60]